MDLSEEAKAQAASASTGDPITTTLSEDGKYVISISELQ